MRRFISVLLIVFSGLLCPAQQYFNTPAATSDPVLVLMNPTVNNLKTVFYLIDNDIFPLPEDYRLVGFYHTAQAYDFSQPALSGNRAGKASFCMPAADCQVTGFTGKTRAAMISALFLRIQRALFSSVAPISPRRFTGRKPVC